MSYIKKLWERDSALQKERKKELLITITTMVCWFVSGMLTTVLIYHYYGQ